MCPRHTGLGRAKEGAKQLRIEEAEAGLEGPHPPPQHDSGWGGDATVRPSLEENCGQS